MKKGVFAGSGPVDVRSLGDGLDVTGGGWKRSVHLKDGALTIEQSTPLPPDGMTEEKRGNISLSIDRTPARAVYTLM